MQNEGQGRPLPTPANEQFIKKIKDRILGSTEWAAVIADITSNFANSIKNSLLTTRGDMIRRGASAPERVGIGTAGQFWKSDGTDPNWVTATITDQWAWFIESPEDKDYDVIINSAYAATIASITTDCTAGTATLTGKINTTNLGGTANSVSTTESEQTHASANVLAAGDNFRITISANSGCENLSVTVKFTRAI